MCRWLILSVLAIGGCIGCHTASIREAAVQFEIEEGRCSATVVGPHTILTAQHCIETEQNTVQMDNKLVPVKKIYLDNRDHALLVLDRDFSRWVKLGPPPRQGDRVCILGNPGYLKAMYRCGMTSGTFKDVTLYDLNIYFGDSGSGIFNEYGQLTATVNKIHVQEDPDSGVMFKLAVSIPLAFTEEQWDSATN